MTDSTSATTAQGLLILLSAPSGAGKTSLVEAVLKRDPNLVVSVSHTTRPKRPGEKDGVNYHFVEPAEFEQMIKAQDFLEHALVFGNHYGTSAKAVEALRNQGRDVILEIDWQGADQVRAMTSDCLSIFIMPPSEDELLNRLKRRGQDSDETIARRFAEAKLDMSKATHYQYIVVNDDFERAVEDLLSILTSNRLTAARQTAHNPVVQTLVHSA